METIIQTINNHIKLLLMNFPKSNNKEVIDFLNLEVNKLQIELASNHKKFKKNNHYQQELQVLFGKLTSISDQLWTSNQTAKEASLIINHLTDHIYERYKPWISEQQKLPLYKLRALEDRYSKDLQIIDAKMRSKNITHNLVLQIIKAINDVFKEGRFPPCSFNQEMYLNILIPQLKKLAEDPRDKHWERRLKQLLIKYNFNSMGIYKFLIQENKAQLEHIKDPMKVLHVLHEINTWLQQIQVIPKLSFQTENPNLKSLLLKEIASYRAHLIERIKLDAHITIPKLACNSSVNELSLYFHYLFDEGLFNYKTKKEAAIAICEHIQSKETKHISAHSFIKFDKLQLNNAALKLYQRNKRIQEKLIKDFDL